jgi:hypothetical protein
MDSPFYLPPNLREYPLRRIQESRAASLLPPPSPWEKPHGLIPHALSPPPAKLPKALLSPRLLRLHIRFLRHRPWHLLPITPSPKPVVQLLVRNLHTQLLRTPRHRFPCRLKLPLPPSRSLSACSALHALIASLGVAYPLQTLRLIPPNPLLKRLVAYPHYRFHPLQTLALSQQPQRLPPPCYLGLFFFSVRLVKCFCSMLSCNLQGTAHTDLL